MDNTLKELIDFAVKRGNRYIKGETQPLALPEKLAELGVFLLEKARKLEGATGDKYRAELIDVQNKVDDTRKALFSCKMKTK